MFFPAVPGLVTVGHAFAGPVNSVGGDAACSRPFRHLRVGVVAERPAQPVVFP